MYISFIPVIAVFDQQLWSKIAENVPSWKIVWRKCVILHTIVEKICRSHLMLNFLDYLYWISFSSMSCLLALICKALDNLYHIILPRESMFTFFRPRTFDEHLVAYFTVLLVLHLNIFQLTSLYNYFCTTVLNIKHLVARP